MQLRDADAADLPAIQAIYAHHVLHGTGTFEDVPPSLAEVTNRFNAAAAHGRRWIAATDASGLLGYAYYTQFRDRVGYRHCAEDSIYVREDVRGQGVGKALIARLIEAATQDGFRQMIAVIGDSENAGSVGVHASLGFRQCGIMRAVGLKFGRWLDVVIMQKTLGPGDSDIPD